MAKRRIKKATIQFISLVPKGANQMPVLYKAEDESASFNCIVKDDRFNEHGELTAIVYVPDRADSQGDVASAQVIKDMAHEYVRSMGAVDVRHDTKALPREKATVVESFVIQKGDPRFSDLKDYSGRPVDATGGWGVVIKIEDQELRRLYREGHWNGVSMFGPAIVEAIKSDGDNLNPGKNDMDIKELKEALDVSNAALAKTLSETLVTAIGKLVKTEPKEEAKPEVNVIKFEGDPSNLDDVRAHQRKIRAALVKWDDPKSVDAYQAALAKEQADEAARNAGKNPELVTAEANLAKAQAEIERLKKGSNQPTGDQKPQGDDQKLTDATGLSKEALDGFKRGSNMAKYINGAK